MPRLKKQLKKPLDYSPTAEEQRAYSWGINNGYIISPLGIHDKPDEYRVGIATVGSPKVVRKDPNTYGHDEVMQKVYEYYVYYYDKYYKNI